MSVQEKVIKSSAQMKMKWWYLPLLIFGSMMVVGGIIGAISL
jgi:hypothetical protein